MAEASDSRGRPHRSPPLRTGLLTAIVTVVALASAGCSTTSDDVADDGAAAGSAIATTTIPEEASSSSTVTTTTPDEVADSAIEVVVSALDAKNSFDLDRWLMAHEGGERLGIPLFAEQILMNARQQWEIVEPCQVTGQTSSGETMVSCVIQDVTGFWGVGGISDAELQTFRVNTDGLITNEFSFASHRRDSFNRAFHQWLSDTYPDVYNELGYGSISSNGPGFDTRNPDHMLVAVEFVEEFVAQSDKYPLATTEN